MISLVHAPDGWVQLHAWSEGPEWDQVPDGWFVTSESDGELVRDGIGYLRRESDGSLSVPHDDRQAWRIAMATTAETGVDAEQLCRRLDRLRERFDDWPAGTAAWTEPPSPPAPDAPIGPVVGGPDGLSYRILSVEDLDAMADQAVASGIYEPRCPGETCRCRPPEAHAWIRLASRLWRPSTWPLVLSWRGRPLQVEQIDLTAKEPVVVLTMHLNRERPHWFWRETWRPVVERLLALGYTAVTTRTRADRPDWIDALQSNYGAVNLGPIDEARVALRIDLATAASRMQGWPARRSVSVPDVKELEPEEAEPLIRKAWGDQHPRLPLALQMAHDWYHLDHAALIAVEDGVRAVRPRRGTTAALGWLTPLSSISGSDRVLEWCRGAGYTSVSAFVPQRFMTLLATKIQEQGFSVQSVHTSFREPFVEVARDL